MSIYTIHILSSFFTKKKKRFYFIELLNENEVMHVMNEYRFWNQTDINKNPIFSLTKLSVANSPTFLEP